MERRAVAEANAKFYDLVARGYERADGRRARQEWLEKIVYSLSKGHDTFLDIGAGTGYVSCIAAKYFNQVNAVDISKEMLSQIPKHKNIFTYCAEANATGFMPNSMDVVCTFATLHHLENITPVFREIHRVLKPHGIYYSDHDIESHFVKRNCLPLAIYRSLVNKKGAFSKISPEAGKLYDTVEHRKNGIDSDVIRITLTAIGFKVFISYHWQGILPIKGDAFKKGYAPMIRVFAIKQ